MTRRLMTLVLVSLALPGTTLTRAEPPKVPPVASVPTTPLSFQDKQHLEQDAFTDIKTVGAIPAPVRQQLLRNSQDPLDGGMADPGQPFQVTDVVGPKRLPFRRLIFVASSPTCCIVCHEFGGYVYGVAATGYRLVNGQPTSQWFIYPQWGRQTPSPTLSELRRTISQGRYYDYTALNPAKPRRR